MRTRFAAGLTVALALAATLHATGTSKGLSGSRWSGGYTLFAQYLTNDASYHNLRMVFTMEFESGDDQSGYNSCPYNPPSNCSWSNDTGNVYTNNLLDSVSGSAGPIVGRFVVWIDYYIDDTYDGTNVHIASWP